MNSWKSKIIIPAWLAIASIVPAAHAQSTARSSNSAKSSQVSVTDAKTSAPGGLIGACAAAAVELSQSRELITALENEKRVIAQRLETEKRTTALLTEIDNTRRSENDALRAALAAKNETIAAKDGVIATQVKLVEALKHKKTPPWKRVGDILIGAAAALILK